VLFLNDFESICETRQEKRMYNIKRGCLKSQFFEKLATKSPRRKALTFNFIFLGALAANKNF